MKLTGIIKWFVNFKTNQSLLNSEHPKYAFFKQKIGNLHIWPIVNALGTFYQSWRFTVLGTGRYFVFVSVDNELRAGARSKQEDKVRARQRQP